jgi:hypothetical protein
VQQSAAEAYRTNGFMIFRQALDPRQIAEVARLEEEVVLPYGGPLLRHDGRTVPHDFYQSGNLSVLERSRSGLMNAHLLKNDSIRPFAEAFARLLSSSPMFDCFHALDAEERYTLHQTIFFFASPLVGPHLDRTTLDTDPLGHSFTAWIPIDPINALNGPVFVIAHPVGEYDSARELGFFATGNTRAMKEAHSRALSQKLQAQGAVMVAPILNPGDLVVFAPSTPHGSFPPLYAKSRRCSAQAVYRATRFDRWGGWPNQGQRHDASAEEYSVSAHFNFLRVYMPPLPDGARG